MAEAKPSTSGIVDGSVFNPLPIGARDLLPNTTRRRRAVSERLLATFEQWGYREVMPPLLEYFEVLGRGLGADERERCVRFIEAGTGELIGLRSDVTPQIARMVAQRVGGTVEPGDALRLSYAATLVRLPAGRHDRAELHQVGVEHVGEDEPEADAELIGLADAALRSLGASAHRFDLAHTAVVRDVLAHLVAAHRLTPAIERELRGRLARKDRDGLLRVLARAGVEGEPARAVAELCELHGEPGILPAARRRLDPVGGGPAVARLEAVVAAVEREHPEVLPRILVDLGEVRGFDYYTGLRMRVWAPGTSEPVVRGGRYDDMLARYGAALPATGFAVDLDALEEALVAAGIEVAGEQLAAARMVAITVGRAGPDTVGRAGPDTVGRAGPGTVGRAGPGTVDSPDAPGDLEAQAQLRSAAATEAREARRQGLRSWIDAIPDGREAAQRMAERRGAERLSWLHLHAGAPICERWLRDPESGTWAREPT